MSEVYDGIYMPHNPTDTQEEAAAAASIGAKRARERVARALADARKEGMTGLTDIETSFVTDLYLNTAAPSRFALVKKGLAEDSGQRRLNERGRKMIVWQLTPEGLEWLA